MTLILDTKFSFFQSMFVLIILFFMFPSVFNLYAEYIMRNAGLEEAQAGIKLLGEISITSAMQMTPPLWQKVEN